MPLSPQDPDYNAIMRAHRNESHSQRKVADKLMSLERRQELERQKALVRKKAKKA